MTSTGEQAQFIRRVRRELRKRTATDEGMARYLDDTVGPQNWVFDQFEKVWITTDPEHRGDGLSYYVIRRGGSWFKATIPADRIS